MIDDSSASASVEDGFLHDPVMVDRIVELLSPVPRGYYVDATLGGGGHALRVGTEIDPVGIIGFDQDETAIAAATAHLVPLGSKFVAVKARFDALAAEIDARECNPVTAILFDLGVSSPQLDVAERGFSFWLDGPLDMRMDRSRSLSASEVVNEFDLSEIRRILKTYGDERFAHRIAPRIIENRPITSTTQLAEIIKDAIPAATRRTGGHPARRSFQALRVFVNSELDVLSDAIDQAIDVLAPGGRCAVLSYQSGEDRIVKRAFKDAVTGGCVCPPALGCGCGAIKRAEFVTRGAERPTEEEIARNRRANPARLRCIQKVAAETVEELETQKANYR